MPLKKQFGMNSPTVHTVEIGSRRGVVRSSAAFHKIVVPLVACLVVICLLTMLASTIVSKWRGNLPYNFAGWVAESQKTRFDDWSDGIVLANLVYLLFFPKYSSIWLYTLPSNSPREGWEQLRYALSAGNSETLGRDLREKRGEYLYRYWTGHLVLTVFALSTFQTPALAATAVSNLVLISLFVYLLAWRKRFGAPSALIVFVVLVGTGVIGWESFHDHTWEITVGLLAGAYTARRLSAAKSYVVAAVVSAVFANWVGYTYVFDTIAFCLPFFLARVNGRFTVEDLSLPIKFAVVFLMATGIMMLLRVPVVYLAGHDPLVFLSQLAERTLYRMSGNFNPQELPPGIEVSTGVAITLALPLLNNYLFNLFGSLMIPVVTAMSYAALQVLPIAGFLAVQIYRNKRLNFESLKPTLVVGLIAILFHVMFLIFVNHACVHPWMDVRHMVFSMAICWGLLAAALTGNGGVPARA
jgi:hypothetical protein